MSVFRDAFGFFDTIGLFDVVLPFLLVFTLIFAVLEKSKIFGTAKGNDGTTYPKKNLNAMVAFCTGFFVVASAQLVEFISIFVARTALILVILVMFIILVAVFYSQQDDKGLDLSAWVPKLLWVVIPAVVLIFLDGVGWLMPLYFYVVENWSSQLVGTVLLFAIIIGVVAWIAKDPKPKGNES